MAESDVESLRKENQELREELEAIKKGLVEFEAHKIVKKAQQGFLTWLALITVGLTAFGILSAKEIMEDVRKKIEGQGVVNIVGEIKEDFINKHQRTVVDETVTRLIPLIESKAELAIQDVLIEKVKNAEKEEGLSLGAALEKAYDEASFYVIIGSAKRPVTLELERGRIVEQLGESTMKEFPEIRIYPPAPNNEFYGLRFDATLPRQEADDLRDRAVEAGFPEDSYVAVARNAG